MYLLCLWVPAQFQASGMLESKIYRAGVASVPTISEIDALSFFWSLELLVVLAAELVIVWICGTRSPRPDRRIKREWKKVALLLIFVGFAATVLFPASLESRAAEGQGLFVLLRTALVCGLAIVAYFDGFKSNLYRLALLGGTVYLILENVRSPLFVILIAYAAGLIGRGAIYKKRVVLSFAVALILAVVSATFMSEMRANITRDEGRGVGEIVSELTNEPIVLAYGAGVDTLDGYRFSALISEYEDARPSDLLSPVTTFIPRAIWPEKPRSISVELSSKYLGYKASGQYLSPIGYLRLAVGSYVGALILFAIFFLAVVYLVLAVRRTFWLAIVLVVLFRFLLGGSAFDVYYGLVLLVVVWGGAVVYESIRFLNGGFRVQHSDSSVLTSRI